MLKGRAGSRIGGERPLCSHPERMLRGESWFTHWGRSIFCSHPERMLRGVSWFTFAQLPNGFALFLPGKKRPKLNPQLLEV